MSDKMAGVKVTQ